MYLYGHLRKHRRKHNIVKSFSPPKSTSGSAKQAANNYTESASGGAKQAANKIMGKMDPGQARKILNIDKPYTAEQITKV